ncbi:MAG: GNAT family N-acetyltransferase, partial [Anaerolineaceae bacterium]|nr:GNAT family N-acetyltransferase [Anaerolineaceae bacterium]
MIPDNRVLLRLLVGHWSINQARAIDQVIPQPYEPILDAWFPGGGT